MECATLFTVGFAKLVPIGALMLISDLPFKQTGVKTASSAKAVFEKYTALHIDVGINVFKNMQARDKKEGLGYRF